MAVAVYQSRGCAATECSAEAMPTQAAKSMRRVPVVSMAKRLAAVPVTAYESDSISFGSSCQAELRSCTNGTLSGSYNNAACSVASAASCTFNGQTIAHGTSINAYESSSVAFGSSCKSQSRTCSNGTLSGSYNNSTCSVAGAQNCSFNGETVNDGQSVTAYQAASVADGSS